MTRSTWLLGAFLFGTLVMAGCGREARSPDPAVTVEVRLDEHRTLGEPIAVANLKVWPVYTDAPLDVGEFLTLQEAQEQKVAQVREVGGAPTQNDAQAASNDVAQQVRGDGAVVNTLVIENTGKLPILVCAGTVLQGGKQDRQIGQDFVIAAGTTVDVDAYCVERGRWASRGIGDAAVAFLSNGVVAPKKVRLAGQYLNDQGKVWAEVGKTRSAVATNTPAGQVREVAAQQLSGLSAHRSSDTGTLLRAIDGADKEVVARRKQMDDTLREAFAKLGAMDRAPVGFAYAVNGKPVTVRAFAHKRLFQSQLPAFLKAMAMEAQMTANEKDASKSVTAADMVALVQKINDAKEQIRDTKAANFNGYRDAEAGFNAKCYLKSVAGGAAPKKDVALTADWTAR